MTIQEIAKIVFETEVEQGLHTGLTFEKWFTSKTEVTVEKSEEEILKEWASSGNTVVKVNKAEVTAKPTENDYSVLFEGLSGKFHTNQILRLISFLNKKNLGKVTKFELREGNKGDIVGNVFGTNESYYLSQSVYLTTTGKQAFRMNLMKVDNK